MKRKLKKFGLEQFPTFCKLVKAAVETATEAKNSAPPIAFVNNIWQLCGVALNISDLKPESMAFLTDQTANREAITAFIKEEFKNEDFGRLEIILEHVIPWIFNDLGQGFELDKALREYDEENEKAN